ncbi:MAG: FecR family protein, partial [Opitutaceae bacterium]
HRSPRRWVRPLAVALAAAAMIAVGVFLRTLPGDAATTIAHIERIERRVLEDGSIVDLNRGAAVAVEYRTAERRVTLLRGEAHFTVMKNPARPFVVKARGIGVQAVGTAFNVAIGDSEVKVLVTEGRVRVDPVAAGATSLTSGEPVPLPLVEAGELAVVSLAGTAVPPQVAPVSPAEMERMLAWQPRMLDFTNTPLPEVVGAFNRRNSVQVVIADPRLDALRLSVSFRSDNVEGFVRLMEGAFGVKAERGAEAIVLRSAP